MKASELGLYEHLENQILSFGRNPNAQFCFQFSGHGFHGLINKPECPGIPISLSGFQDTPLETLRETAINAEGPQ